MNYIKKVTKSLVISFIPMLIFIFLFTILEYFGVIGNTTFRVLTILASILSFLIGGIIFGKKIGKKGLIEGIKLSIIEIIIFIIINLILVNTNIKNLILYLGVLLTTTIGSIIGVNKSSLSK